MQLKYRRDIDGLRCLAIAPVVMFHAGLGFPGGFIGVDIFFVISGYLISLGLFGSNESGEFSLIDFYERRIRRIIPALSAVLLATFVVGLLVLLPSEMVALSQSTASAALFVSNIYFWATQNYFDGGNFSKPLLHTWSLSVEEQFYIVWPVVVWGIYKLKAQKYRVMIIILGILASFAAAEMVMSYSPRTPFYMFPLRAWELLIGALVATGSLPKFGRRGSDLLSIIALAMIGASIFLYSEETRFPGLTAVPPCLGAAILIHVGADPKSLGARLLSLRPLVLVGLISYSLYLWHWPLFSFFEIVEQRPPTMIEAVALVAGAVGLAILSWRFVEMPFRRRPAPSDNPIARRLPRLLKGSLVIPLGVAAIMATTAIGLIGAKAKGFPDRVPATTRAIEAMARNKIRAAHGCIVHEDIPGNWEKRCFGTDRDQAETQVVLWGDSFASQHVTVLDKMLADRGVALRTVVAKGCLPTPGATPTLGLGRADPRCRNFNDRVLARLDQLPNLKMVIIGGRWSNIAGLDIPGGVQTTARNLLSDRYNVRSPENTLAALDESLNRVVAGFAARGIRVVLLAEPPRYARPVKECVARAIWAGQPWQTCATDAASQRSFRRPVNDILVRLAAKYPNVSLYDPLPLLCPNSKCAGYANGRLLTFDIDHVTVDGSRLALRNLVLPSLDNAPGAAKKL